jgi:hypothetical protein
MLFPVMSAAAVFVFAVLVFGAFYASGTFDRYGEDGGATPLDLGIMFLAYLGVAFVVIYFNAALIACAFERLRGGSSNLRYGLRSSNRRIGSMLGWAIMSATVGLILDYLRAPAVDRRGVARRRGHGQSGFAG